MADNRDTAFMPILDSGRPSVSLFANSVADSLSSKMSVDKVLDALQAASIAGDRRGCDAVLRAALASGIAVADCADVLIPAIAKRLGVLWERDEIGFAEVSIASSRLQVLLRQLGEMWEGQLRADHTAPTILLVAPAQDQHTLGASVLAGRLRRSGFSVGLMLGVTTQQVVERLGKGPVDAIFVSAYRSDPLDHLRQMVDFIRGSLNTVPPIVIGGQMVASMPDVAALTGADFATNDPDEAIEFCGLSSPQMISAPRAARI